MNKTYIHILSEEKYLQYLIKISEEKKIIYDLLFVDFTVGGQEHIMAELCECYSSLLRMEKVLQEAEDSFSSDKQEFYLADDVALKFILFLSSVATVKEKLPLYNISLSLH